MSDRIEDEERSDSPVKEEIDDAARAARKADLNLKATAMAKVLFTAACASFIYNAVFQGLLLRQGLALILLGTFLLITPFELIVWCWQHGIRPSSLPIFFGGIFAFILDLLILGLVLLFPFVIMVAFMSIGEWLDGIMGGLENAFLGLILLLPVIQLAYIVIQLVRAARA